MEVEIFRGMTRRRDHDGREGIGVELNRVGWSEESDCANFRVNDGAWWSTRVHDSEVDEVS